MRFKPLRDLVVIQPYIPTEKTLGGIIIPSRAIPVANEGTVVAIGPGRVSSKGVRVPIEVPIGSHVRFDEGGMDIELDGYKLKILPEHLISGILS